MKKIYPFIFPICWGLGIIILLTFMKPSLFTMIQEYRFEKFTDKMSEYLQYTPQEKEIIHLNKDLCVVKGEDFGGRAYFVVCRSVKENSTSFVAIAVFPDGIRTYLRHAVFNRPEVSIDEGIVSPHAGHEWNKQRMMPFNYADLQEEFEMDAANMSSAKDKVNEANHLLKQLLEENSGRIEKCKEVSAIKSRKMNAEADAYHKARKEKELAEEKQLIARQNRDARSAFVGGHFPDSK